MMFAHPARAPLLIMRPASALYNSAAAAASQSHTDTAGAKILSSCVLPFCLCTMLSCLLLLLSLVSVEASAGFPGPYSEMVYEVLNRRLTGFFFYGCQCGWSFGIQIVDDIDRCCHEHRCCRAPLRTHQCKPEKAYYHFTYCNETLTCDDEDESSCARRSCECDRTAVFCFQRYNYTKVKTKLFNKNTCTGRRPSCSEV
ncbi:basic phospholipase A2 caudoxin-like [Engystomops pustulosus]|uniref:basic phospholipase A2 caudoxin-like n=1 Tax=Engystomops pustulosus TaxID=76066 RepID=UPI003AFAE0BA